MKKNKIFAAVMLLTMFSSLFAIGTVTQPAQTGSASAPDNTLFTPDVIGDPMGNKGIFAGNATTFTIVNDGDLSDWDGLPFEFFRGVNVSIAYDATNVYIALQWKDTSNDVKVGQWNKTGHVNPSLVDWDFVAGADDVVQVGFSDGPHPTNKTDLMIWTASPRTNPGFAFECNATGYPDSGTLPFVMNTNETGTFTGAKPLYESDLSTLITNELNLANGTMYDAWLNSTTIPTVSQINTVTVGDWNTTLKDHYTIEMTRLLDTSQADDIKLDFTKDLLFHLGTANQDNTFDMLIPTRTYSVALTNEAANLTFATITTNPVTSTLVITGAVFDDYLNYGLTVHLTGWDDTYGPGTFAAADVNEITGIYTYLFFFNERHMPLGEHIINVTLTPMYEAPIMLNQTIVIKDIKAPAIEGIVDLKSRYPSGVPLDEDYVTVTVGLSDDYYSVNDIAAYLYSYVGNDVALRTDMKQFSSGGTTFSANITIDHAIGTLNNYTYFIQAWDKILNKVTSEYYWFLAASIKPTPAFGIIAGLFGLAASVFIIKKIKK